MAEAIAAPDFALGVADDGEQAESRGFIKSGEFLAAADSTVAVRDAPVVEGVNIVEAG